MNYIKNKENNTILRIKISNKIKTCINLRVNKDYKHNYTSWIIYIII